MEAAPPLEGLPPPKSGRSRGGRPPKKEKDGEAAATAGSRPPREKKGAGGRRCFNCGQTGVRYLCRNTEPSAAL